jgi:hypothetical protein
LGLDEYSLNICSLLCFSSGLIAMEKTKQMLSFFRQQL